MTFFSFLSQCSAVMSPAFLNYLQNNVQYYLSVTKVFFLSPFPLGFRQQMGIFLFPSHHARTNCDFFFSHAEFICHVLPLFVVFHNIVLPSCCSLRSLTSLQLLNCNLSEHYFFSPTLLEVSEQLTDTENFWDGLLGDFLSAS